MKTPPPSPPSPPVSSASAINCFFAFLFLQFRAKPQQSRASTFTCIYTRNMTAQHDAKSAGKKVTAAPDAAVMQGKLHRSLLDCLFLSIKSSATT
jgi:hypothetical protein